MADMPPLYDLYDEETWHASLHLTAEQAAKFTRRGYRVVIAAPGQVQPQVEITTHAVQKSLDDPIDVPHDCTCAYIRIETHGLVQRHANPDCTEHGFEDDGELIRERD